MHIASGKNGPPMPYKVAWLTNYIPPYAAPLFRALSYRFDRFRLFISVDMEANRHWVPEWEGLDVNVQRTFTLHGNWRHPHGFSEPLNVHIPYDTLYALRSYRPDVIISSEMGLRTLQALAYRQSHRKSRLLIRACLSETTERGRGRLRDWLRNRLLPRVDGVMVNGRSGANYIRRFNVPDTRLFFTPSTSDLRPFSSVALDRPEESSRRLLYVGRLVEAKGLLLFMELLSRWASNNPRCPIQFWLAGDGPLRTPLAQVKVPPNVSLSLLGNVAYEDLPKVYASGGILAFPTLADEWGMVVNESLASGLPVLGSLYSQAVEELIEDDVNGWTFRPDEPEKMYSALDRAMSIPKEFLCHMRAAARNAVEGLTPEYVAAQVAEAIRAVCV
jgi:hypothetical protein